MKAAESYFLISEAEIERIDSLVGALNLAITEVLESRPVRDHRAERTELQQQYDELIMPHLYPEPALDPDQTAFGF